MVNSLVFPDNLFKFLTVNSYFTTCNIKTNVNSELLAVILYWLNQQN